MKLSKKVILLGHFGVGKTSLIRRFVHSKFSEEYLTTIGVKIDKKVLDLGETELTMIIWDIEGGALQSKLPKSYFLGAAGIIYVCDLTRPSTYASIDEELAYFKNLLPKASLKIVANKTDLLEEDKLEELQASIQPGPDFYTSAKTGELVEDMFEGLGLDMVS